MTDPHPPTITGYHRLPPAERAAVESLRDLCNTHDGTDLKLAYGDLLAGPPSQQNVFLATQAGTLAGVVTLIGDDEIEVAGMVHPDRRRRGIGRALLDTALAACRQRGAQKALLICEAAVPAGAALAQAAGGQLEFAEDHMERDTPESWPAPDPRLDLRRAGHGEADIAIMARVIAASFGDPEEVVRGRLAEDLEDPTTRYYIGWAGGAPVGALKTYLWPERTGIYAFGVLPTVRGQGWGRGILTAVMRELQAEGRTHLALEVETENAPAVALYHHLGFRTTTTYKYYAITLTTPT
jgi:ribosomal protein S18 acetylase RimI-like enzyme